MSNTLILDRNASKTSPSVSVAAAQAVSSLYALVVAVLASVMRPQAESPAEAAARLRMMATQYEGNQPSYAADLRAAADRAQG